MSDFRKNIKPYSEAPITRHLLLESLTHYGRPNDKISELIRRKDLISLRRGLYAVGENLDLPAPEPFMIANHLRGPSYISLESALSYYEMIPERTYEVSSVTIKSSKDYTNDMGRFSFKKLETPYYSYGISTIEFTDKQRVLIASPEKALCDKIVLTRGLQLRSIKNTLEYLIEDLRIDEDSIAALNTDIISSWIENAPKSSSLEMLIKAANKL